MHESMIGTGSTAARVAIDLAISLTQTSYHTHHHTINILFCVPTSQKRGQRHHTKREAPSRLISRALSASLLSLAFTPQNQNPNLFRFYYITEFFLLLISSLPALSYNLCDQTDAAFKVNPPATTAPFFEPRSTTHIQGGEATKIHPRLLSSYHSFFVKPARKRTMTILGWRAWWSSKYY